MAIHFNIGEAKAKLSQLIAAAKRGEDVVIDHDGKPQVRLSVVGSESDAERRARARQSADPLLACGNTRLALGKKLTSDPR